MSHSVEAAEEITKEEMAGDSGSQQTLESDRFGADPYPTSKGWSSLSLKRRDQLSEEPLAHAADPGSLSSTITPDGVDRPVGGDASGATHFSTSGAQRKKQPRSKALARLG
ncbi:Homeobox Protein Hox-C12 [Manis pentadactyla]|nr:Homeobox Protein Hox-C12 [Manis pentadactyla]